MENKMKVRRLSPEEITPEVCKWYTDLMRSSEWQPSQKENPTMLVRGYDENFMANFWKGLVDLGIALFSILENDKGKMVGMLTAVCGPDDLDGSVICFERHWRVNREGSGHGKDLFDDLELWAREKNCVMVVGTAMHSQYYARVSENLRSQGYFLYSSEFFKLLH